MFLSEVDDVGASEPLRALLLAGLVLFTGISVVCGIAPIFWLLIAARAVQASERPS